jgi:DNA-binding LytR/AlgR family response regulator
MIETMFAYQNIYMGFVKSSTTTIPGRQSAAASILLPAGRNMECFLISDIVRLEACSNYTYIHFINHRPLLMAKVMRLFEDLLQPHGFIRTHRGHVINPLFASGIDREGTILLKDQSRIPYSRRRKKEVMRLLNTGLAGVTDQDASKCLSNL